MSDKYAELIKIERDIEKLEKKAKELRTDLLSDVRENGGRVSNSYGLFRIYARRVWTYPSEVLETITSLTNNIKEIKYKAQSNGTATFKEDPYLRVDKKKITA